MRQTTKHARKKDQTFELNDDLGAGRIDKVLYQDARVARDSRAYTMARKWHSADMSIPHRVKTPNIT
jgi:hypothetical protein